MALQKSIDNLKQRPKDERTAVASGIAIAVAAILFIGWLIYFIHKIQSGAITPSFDSSGADAFNPQSAQDAQAALQAEQNASNQDLLQLRDQIQSQQQGSVQQTSVQQNQSGTDQFGLPNSNQ